MNYLFVISVFSALSVLSINLQSFSFMQIGSVSPNFFLVLIASLLIFYKRNIFFIILFPALSLVFIWSILFSPFWIEGIIIIGISSILISFIDTKITGTKLIDLLIIVFVLTTIFYLVFWLIGVQEIGWFLLGEILYNLILAPLFYFTVKRIKLSI